jgi:hypothetical protein
MSAEQIHRIPAASSPRPPRDEIELAFAGAARLAELVRVRTVTPRELVELYLRRIERLDPALNAFRVVYAERALADADEAARRLNDGDRAPLLGVPVAVKDQCDVAGDVTLYGTGLLGEPAIEDCEAVRRLRLAGAIPIGKTRMPELGLWPFTESAAWGTTRIPGSLSARRADRAVGRRPRSPPVWPRQQSGVTAAARFAPRRAAAGSWGSNRSADASHSPRSRTTGTAWWCSGRSRAPFSTLHCCSTQCSTRTAPQRDRSPTRHASLPAGSASASRSRSHTASGCRSMSRWPPR